MIYKRLIANDVEVTNSNLQYLQKAVVLSNAVRTKRLPQQVKLRKMEEVEEYKSLLLQSPIKQPLIDQQELNAKTLQDLMSHGDCDICFDSMLGKRIFACSNDHWVCEGCLLETKCPMCQEDLRQNRPRRCYTVEKVVSLIHQLNSP